MVEKHSRALKAERIAMTAVAASDHPLSKRPVGDSGPSLGSANSAGVLTALCRLIDLGTRSSSTVT
jgi:hypothetical protein